MNALGRQVWQVAGAGGLALALASTHAHADDAASEGPPAGLGDTAWALPGFVRVGVPGVAARRVAISGSAGYGLTEGQSRAGAPAPPTTPADSAHHRLIGGAAIGVAPISALELALRFDGRYDLHPDDGGGTHSGAVGDPRLLARYGVRAGEALRLGVEAAAWFPGKSAPSLSLDATTVDARALAAWAPRTGPVVGLGAGFRFDQSHKVAPPIDRLRSGDRLALGLSDFNAVLVGVGIAVPVGSTEILGELSAELLVGAAAPGVGKSPLRITGGVRQRLTEAFGLEGLVEVSPSGRPSLGPTEPLVPVEPRFSIVLGLRCRLPFDAPPRAAARAPDAARTTTAPVAPAAPVASTTTTLVVRVVAEDGAAQTAAVVTIVSGETSRVAPGAGDGTYRLDGVAPGAVKISVTAEGFAPVEQSVNAGPDTAGSPVEIKLTALPPSGEIRGLIRSFNGTGLPATVRVEPGGAESKADAQGAFTLVLPPGDYEVTIKASRFKEQHRKVHVDKNGVTVINAELFEGK